MSESSIPPDGQLNAAAISAASGQLLDHLRRSGIRLVPKANVEAVENWSAQFAAETEVAESSATESLGPGALGPGALGPGALGPGALGPGALAPAVTPAPKPGLAAKPDPKADPARNRMAPVAAVISSSESYPGAALPIAQRQAQLESLAAVVAGCEKCKALTQCRTQTVFGEGSPQARFVFFGEGPVAQDDKAGRPFMDKAGQLLTKMIQACHLSREEVYLMNSVKCRPPGDRNPDPTEVGNCREYFEQQLELIRPEYIICLGAVPSQALLKTKLSIGRLRQTFHTYRDSKVMAIYHPAYLLRNPDAKRAAWADLQLLMKDAGL